MPFVLGFLVSFWCVTFLSNFTGSTSLTKSNIIHQVHQALESLTEAATMTSITSCNHGSSTRRSTTSCQVLGSFRWFRWSTRSMNYLNSAQIGDPSISKSSGIPCVEGLDVRLGCKCLMNPVWVHQGSLINQDNSGEWRQDLHAKWWYYPDPPDPLRSPEVSEVRCN